MTEMDVSWMPGASLELLKKRAWMLDRIRQFFKTRHVLEVETPIMSRAGNTDPHLESFFTQFRGPGSPDGRTMYLQTSPEFAMKRLLASGSGDIFQVCKVFRNEEKGRLHNPEFTMLEWYRLGFDHHALMDEINDLLVFLGLLEDSEVVTKITYSALFEEIVGINPNEVSVAELYSCARQHQLGIPDSMAANIRDESERNDWLDLIMTQAIEPVLRERGFVFVFDFPASQASLARISEGSTPVAERFELFANGVELANGFHELTDPEEQKSRFHNEVAIRSKLGLMPVAMDQQLLAALQHGLPDCSGVAVGLDRMLMCLANKHDISAVLAFDHDQA
jgi:lysyl-tRNA synthetase class 2